MLPRQLLLTTEGRLQAITICRLRLAQLRRLAASRSRALVGVVASEQALAANSDARKEKAPRRSRDKPASDASLSAGVAAADLEGGQQEPAARESKRRWRQPRHQQVDQQPETHVEQQQQQQGKQRSLQSTQQLAVPTEQPGKQEQPASRLQKSSSEPTGSATARTKEKGTLPVAQQQQLQGNRRRRRRQPRPAAQQQAQAGLAGPDSQELPTTASQHAAAPETPQMQQGQQPAPPQGQQPGRQQLVQSSQAAGSRRARRGGGLPIPAQTPPGPKKQQQKQELNKAGEQEASRASRALGDAPQQPVGDAPGEDGSLVTDRDRAAGSRVRTASSAGTQHLAAESEGERRRRQQMRREPPRQQLEQLHSHRKQEPRQQTKQARSAAASTKSSPLGQKQQDQEQDVEPQQPRFAVEAAEVLCGVGMSPAGAAAALLAAHEYSIGRRGQQAAGADGALADGGAATQQQAQAADAQGDGSSRTAGAGHAAVPPVGRAEVEAVCRELADTVKVPVAQLPRLLEAAPQLLACRPSEIRKQHEVVSSVWRRPRKLVAAILQHPGMLAPEFPAQLGRSLQVLSSLGFSREQVSTAILNYPAVTQLTRQDIVRHLLSAGLDLANATGEVLQFLAEQSHLLGAEGSALLASRLALFASWRMAPPLCPLVLARCPALLKEPEQNMQGIVDILMGYGMTWRQLGDALLGYPPVLRADPGTVRLTLKLLADFEIGLEKVAQYPRVFIHDPVQTIGPRLAYLKAYRPAKLQFRLVTLLSRCDDEFAVRVCDRLEEEYAVFKATWVRQYHEQVNLPTGRSSLSRRIWSKEVTDELWL